MNYPVVYNIKDIYGNQSEYYVDDWCNMYRYDGIEFKPIHVWHREKDGRPVVKIDIGEGNKQYLVYRLLMRTAANMTDEEFSHYVVDHKDCDTNHNYFDNFDLVSQAENMRRAGINNLMKYGEDHHNSKYKNDLVNSICCDIVNGMPRHEIMEKYKVNGQLVDDIHSGRSHKKISEKYIPYGFSYKVYDRTPKELMAHEVCKLLESGKTVTDIVKEFGYDRNFVYSIYANIAYKDISRQYNFKKVQRLSKGIS